MRFLGKSGLQISELCLGTATFGSSGEYEKSGHIDQQSANVVINLALDAGINFFNTAETYSGGTAEEILGTALGSRRREAVIITKVNSTRISGANEGGLSRNHIIEGCNASLKRLKTDYIDLFELHRFDPCTPLEVTLKALDDLVRQGKVRYTGCSNFTGWQLMKALWTADQMGLDRFITLESQYSLVSRWLEFELIPACQDQGLGVLAFSPLHGGFLSGKYRRGQPWPQGTRFDNPTNTEPWPIEIESLFKVIDELDKIALEHNCTVSQAALNYLLQKPGVTSLIIGIRNVNQLRENLKATGWQMAPEEVARLDRVSEIKRRYPYFIYDPDSKK
jgi:aryl-alcohol dehydrogenase-like predicted oxidoreductase